jgi:diaminopimelate epimerase
MNINFKKMHGLGNDFVIIDGRENGITLTPDQVRFIADRKRGVGCDQLIMLERSKNWIEMNFMRIYNPDGSEAEACGNATRCLADLLMVEDDVDHIVIESVAGSLNCWKEDNQIRVEMGKPQLNWQEIPLSKECDTLHLPLEGDPAAVSMGNPHCVFFVDKLEDISVEEQGGGFETDHLFPKKTNVEFVEVLDRQHLRMRVWERGAGITQACGSGACAIAVAAICRGLTERKVTVTLDGGDLVINWPNDDAPVSMTGPVAYVFDGEIEV